MQVFIVCFCAAALLGTAAFFPPMFNVVFERWYTKKSPDELEKYRVADVRKNVRDLCRERLKAELKTVWLLAAAGTLLGFLIYVTGSGGSVVKSVDRPDFGLGETEVELVANLEGETRSVLVKVGEVAPDQDEADSFFAAACEAALAEVLGENDSFDCVTQDLNLISVIDGIEISWKTDSPELVSSLGVIGADISQEGAAVTLTMTMSYGGLEAVYDIEVTVFPRTQDEEKDELSEYINNQLADSSQASKTVALPTEYDSRTLVLTEQEDNSGQNLALLVMAAALVIWLSQGKKLDDDYAKRNAQLEADYPGIVSRLSILFCAGLTVPAAWQRLADEYERGLKNGKPVRSAYEELRLTAQELANTGYSQNTFRSFGARCGSYRYMKLADVLDTSMKKGTLKMTQYMEQEAQGAFELRKMQAQKAGEEAGTKLLIPMMLMFVLVIAMVVVPAWSGMM